MEDSNPVKTPIETRIKLLKEGDGKTIDATYFKQIVGSLRYLTCTRLDICMLWDWLVDTWSHLDKFIYKL